MRFLPLLALLYSSFAWAAPGEETYDVRPDILTVAAQAHPELGPAWPKFRQALLHLAATVSSTYPDREIYCLARDGELIYDLLRLMGRADPKLASRIHLLNVSTANMNSKHLKDYLVQEGISETALRSGKKVLFLDSGWKGTIPNAIAKIFPAEFRHQFSGHFVTSLSPQFPSSRLFTFEVDSVQESGKRFRVGSAVGNFEQLPHRTATSREFVRGENGEWKPQSLVHHESINNPDPPQAVDAVKLMEDLARWANDPETSAQFSREKAIWDSLRPLLRTPDPAPLVADLKSRLSASPKDPFTESLVRDALEIRAKGMGHSYTHQPTSLSVGLQPDRKADLDELKEWFPALYFEYRDILKDSQHSILSLIRDGNYRTLTRMVREIRSPEFPLEMLIQGLASHSKKVPVTPELTELAIALKERLPVEKPDPRLERLMDFPSRGFLGGCLQRVSRWVRK